MTEAIVDIVPQDAKGKPPTLSAKKIKDKYGDKNAPRDPDAPDMFKGKAKGAIKPVKKKAEPAPGDGEGPGWKDAPDPKKLAAARKKAGDQPAAKKASAKKPAGKAKPDIIAAKPKAKPKTKAAPKPPAKVKAEKPKQTRVRDKTPTTAILIRMNDAELAKLDKKRGTGESRPGALIRLAREAIGAPAKK